MNFGGNGIIWILLISMLTQCGGGSACGGGCGFGFDSSTLILLLFIMMLGGNSGFGICEAK